MRLLVGGLAIAVSVGLPSAAAADPEVGGRGDRVVLEDADRSLAREKAARLGTRTVMPAGKPRRDSLCFFNSSQVVERRYEPTFRCGARGYNPTEAQPADAPELTEGDIRRAVSEIPMPSLQIQVQPGESTLVNIPTIFHTDPRTLRESVTLLGFDIDVEATPVRYTWRPGDGSAMTTSKPGRPYPAKDVTHTYRRVAEQVSPRVDTTYSVRYRVDGGAWQPLGQDLTAVGEPTSLEVEEAAPVLVTP